MPYLGHMTTAVEMHIPTWTVGDRCRKAREDRGYGSAEFATLIGVSRNTIGNVESGRVQPRKIVLNAWALVTGVPLEWLRDGTVPTTDGNGGGRAWRDSNPQPSDPKVVQITARRVDRSPAAVAA